MMAMLFACRVVEGRTEWARVPAKLKAPVAGIILGDFSLPELVPAEYGGTADAGAANAGTAATGAAAAGAAGTGAQA